MAVISTIVYFFFMRYLYRAYITEIWSYDAFTMSVTGFTEIMALLLLTPALIFMYFTCDKEAPSYQIVNIFTCIGLIPTLVLAEYKQAVFLPLILVYYYLLIFFTVLLKPIRIKSLSLPGSQFCKFIAFVFALTIVYVWVVYAHMHVQTSVTDVYGQRALSGDFQLSTIQKYIFSMGSIIVPFFAIYELDRKKYLFSLVMMATALLSFFTNGMKGTFFTMLFGLLGYLIIKRIRDYLWLVPLALSLLGAVCSLIQGQQSLTLISLFFRRAQFVPAGLNYDYYGYFCDKEKDFFRSSFGLLDTSPYGNIPKLIGVYNGNGSSCNNGLFSDAYCNLGVAGMVIMPFLIVVILKMLDGVTEGMRNELTFLLVLSFTMSLLSSSLFTNLLSHGMGIMILILYFLRDERNSRDIASFPTVVERG